MGIVKDFINSSLSNIFGSGTLGAVGIAGYVAGVRIKEEVVRTSTVTSTVVEDGSTIADHIINQPTIITIEGEIGNVEIVAKQKRSHNADYTTAPGIITSFLPERTSVQLTELSNTIDTIDNVIDGIDSVSDITSIFDLFQPLTTKEEKLRFYQHFERLYESKSLVDVEMVDKVYKNMAISYFRAVESGGNYVGYKIILQEVRFAKTLMGQNEELKENPSEAVSTQTQKKKEVGTVSGEEKGSVADSETESLLYTLVN